MDIRKIKKLIDLMIESDLQAIEVKEGDQSISLTRPTPVYAAAPWQQHLVLLLLRLQQQKHLVAL
jgi:hypothetical protein